MLKSIKRKLVLNVFIMVGLLFMIPLLQNQVQGQYSGQPGTADLEEQLELAEEKIRNAQSQGSYGGATTNTQPNNPFSDFFNNFLNMLGLSLPGFTKYIDPSGTINFQYPSDWIKLSEINLSNFGVSFGSPIENNQRSVFTLSAEDAPFLIWNDYKDTRVSELEGTNLFGYKITGIQGPFDTTLSGIPAFQIQFISPVLGGLDTIEINALKDGKLYTVSYQGKPEPYQKHMGSFNKILSTIKIK